MELSIENWGVIVELSIENWGLIVENCMMHIANRNCLVEGNCCFFYLYEIFK